jgi:acetolactate synthase-1/2/3 large subunit
MRVVDAMVQWMEEAGINHYFGYAGGAMWPLMDALIEVPQIEGIQAKHESHAVHMADIYYRVTGTIAPVFVTKGPGLMNTTGAIATAMHDPAAVLLIAGAGSTHLYGKGGMQEMYYKGHEDAVNVMRPITKGSWLIQRPDTAIDVINHAYKVAVSGRPGPVFVQVPFDIQLAEIFGHAEVPFARISTSRRRADRDAVERTATLLLAAERPVLMAGGGCQRSPGSATALARLLELLPIPFVTTLTAKGIVSESHPLSLGPVGRSGTDAAAEVTRNADVLVAVGARFSDNNTSNWRNGLVYSVPKTKIVQINIEDEEIGRNYPVEIGIVADAASFLNDLADEIAARPGKSEGLASWNARAQEWKSQWREKIRPVITSPTDPIHPGRLAYEVGEAIKRHNGRIFCDIGDVVQYAEPYMEIEKSDAWHISPGMAEMGWASSGVLGAVAADSSRPAIALTGDGAFNMTSQILATAVEYQLPAVWVILNNHEFGIERKGSVTAYGRQHPWTRFVRKDTGEPYNPDYTMLAEANGAHGTRVTTAAGLGPALDEALASGTPWVIDVEIDLTIPTYFTAGIDRAYPNQWTKSYPLYSTFSLQDPDA